MFAICPDKLKFVARLKTLDVTIFSKKECELIKQAITYIAVTCVLRPRSELAPKMRMALTIGSDKEFVKAISTFNFKVTALDRLRVMREHVKHMDGYKLPSTKELNQMYNDLNVPDYPFEGINQIPTDKQRAHLIALGIAEQDYNYKPDEQLGPDDIHPTVNMAIDLIDNLYFESAGHETQLRNALKKAKHRVLVSGIIHPNKPIPGYFFRNLRVKRRKELIATLEGYANRANGHDVAKVMAIHVAMAVGYTTPTTRTHSTAKLAELNYDVTDFLNNDYPLSTLSKLPTQEQLEWQVKYGYAQRIFVPNVGAGMSSNVTQIKRKV